MPEQEGTPQRRLSRKPRRFRLQFDAALGEREQLDRIRNRAGVRTYSEALRIGLRVLDRLLQYKEEGYSVVVARNGETKQIELLW